MKHIRLFIGLLTVLLGILKSADFVTASDLADLEDADVDAYGHVSVEDKESVEQVVSETVSRTTQEASETIIEEETDNDSDDSSVNIAVDEVPEAPIEVEQESYATETIPTEETTTEPIPTGDNPYVDSEEKAYSSETSPQKIPFSLALSSKDSLAFLKNKFTGAVERVKGLTPAEVKKAAAGALGAWGAAVGIRFALQRGG
jgi:hypothetical protein